GSDPTHSVPSGTLQLCANSLHTLAHCGPPAHGLPACAEHVPPLHVSAPLQNNPSLQGVALGAALCVHAPAPLQVPTEHEPALGQLTPGAVGAQLEGWPLQV